MKRSRLFFVFIVLALLVASLSPIASAQEAPVPMFEDIVQQYTNWVFYPVAEAGRNVVYEIDGERWELPLESWFATDRSNGRVEAADPDQSSPDLGYCKTGQRDCLNHSLLWRVTVPRELTQCIESVRMDIAHRVTVRNVCQQPVPVRISVRFNLKSVTNDPDWGLTSAQLVAEFANLNTGSPALMFSSEAPISSTYMLYSEALGEGQPFQYACWDCFADTAGANALAVPLTDVSTDGPNVAPLGRTVLPGVSISIANPATEPDWQYTALVVMPDVGEGLNNGLMNWIGEFDPELAPLTIEGQGGGAGETPIGNVIVEANRLNIRSSPSLTAPIVAVAEKGDTWAVFTIEGDWVRIPNGWVMTGDGFSTYTEMIPRLTPTPEVTEDEPLG